MRSRRAGFTLVEVLVAVMLIDVGLLALVAGSAVLVRRAAEVRARSNALHAAANRIQMLGAGPCAQTTGAAATGDVRESWGVVVRPNHVREVSDSVTFSAAGVAGTVALRTRFPC
jgi:Tfp pilus assembly protein PilV